MELCELGVVIEQRDVLQGNILLYEGDYGSSSGGDA